MATHRITKQTATEKAYTVTLQDGTVMPVVDKQAVVAGCDLWKTEGHEGGYLPTVGLKLIDPEGHMNQYLAPTGAFINGSYRPDGYAAIVSHVNRPMSKGGMVVLAKLDTSNMSAGDWDDMNPDSKNGLYTHAKSYEVLNGTELAAAVERNVVDEDGKPRNASAVMLLGDEGRGGLVIALPMHDWGRKTAETLGTGGKDYLVIRLRHDHISTDVTSHISVCQNAMLARLGKRTDERLTASHGKGVMLRIEEVLKTAWERGLQTSNILEQAMLTLQATPMNEEQTRQMLEEVLPLPGMPKENYFGVLSYEQRLANRNARANTTLAHREMVVEAAHRNPQLMELAGVTRAAHGTAFGVTQALTWTGTYFKAGSAALRTEAIIAGERGQEMSDGIQWMLRAAGFEYSAN